MTGEIFGRLTVLEEFLAPAGRYGGQKMSAYVSCECGRRKIVLMTNLRRRKSLSCGVCNRTADHGDARRGKVAPIYAAWRSMLRRCNNPDDKKYGDYGGRGITVCERWYDYQSFREDMAPRPVGMTLDRIDVNGNYEPGNCRWATQKTQNRNRRSNKPVEYNGKRYETTIELLEEKGLADRYSTIFNRLKRGWSVVEAVDTPIREGNYGKR